MKVIAAYIIMFGCIGWLLFAVVIIAQDASELDADELLALIGIIIPAFSGIYIFLSLKENIY